jgi:putative Holliday junction resolvase
MASSAFAQALRRGKLRLRAKRDALQARPLDYGPSTASALPSITMRVVGIDLGERRIGVAVSDATATLARPLKTLERGTSDAEAVEQLRSTILALADEEAVGSVVVGLPRRLDGSPNLQTPRVTKMVAMLTERLPIPVFTQDERLSSHEADERLALREKDWRRRKTKLDAAAAAVILQDYLDARK